MFAPKPRAARRAWVSAFAFFAAAPIAHAGDSHTIAWRSDFDKARAEAKARNLPLWVQFTGPWCIYCRKMDRETFVAPEVVAQSKERFVPVKIRSDEREDLVAHFGISGLPATLILTPEGQLQARQDGFADAGEFLGVLASIPAPPPRPGDGVALAGFCPVTLVRGQGLTQGQKRFAVRYDGHEFRFATAAERDAFLAEPEKFLPSNGGKCVVSQVERGESVPGNARFGVFYKERLYLLATEDARRSFAADPEKFAHVDVAQQGNCPHCRTLAGRIVRGLPEFVATHSGMRYFFPDKTHLEAFRAEPEKYLR
jgi:YHS domain-containing protein/thiol-disulfide isomerase/thioredoxin